MYEGPNIKSYGKAGTEKGYGWEHKAIRLLFDTLYGHLQRGPFGDLELSRDDHCDRVAVSECLAGYGNLLTDFHDSTFV